MGVYDVCSERGRGPVVLAQSLASESIIIVVQYNIIVCDEEEEMKMMKNAING